eukprot:CAMPEP_0183707542 /NCGR_PEP_ID=MMETSP0737-20130205/4090_1 /TAXON_ID=385413 /ORGANISM="Thalassiosira miniscula, Strain CCMP1093" /LENGTH=391 /DNA_ID=CAMNT_0025935239 /DNA_START=1004 /DNA_END=2176 /DNA_ORIENTATION=+
MDADIDGLPFSVLMDRAVKLKSSQTAHQREKYDAFPSWLKNTVWPNEDVNNARKLEVFSDRLAAATIMKEEGNAAFRSGRLSDAMSKYENALSVFQFLENTNPNWKTEGIKDQFLHEVEYSGKDEDERKELKRFLASCYNNVALASYKMKDYSLAVKACDYAISVDRRNHKALFIRAKARLAPKSSGVVEQELARSDLRVALRNNPDNKDATKLLRKLNAIMKAQQRNDRETFKDLFGRGEIYDSQELHEQREHHRKRAEEYNIKSKDRDMNIARDIIRSYEERGLEKEKRQLESSLAEAKRTKDIMDFRNPSVKMIEDAEKMGVDLKDPQTVAFLEKMKAVHNEVQGKGSSKWDSTVSFKASANNSKMALRKLITIVSGSFIFGCIFLFW